MHRRFIGAAAKMLPASYRMLYGYYTCALIILATSCTDSNDSTGWQVGNGPARNNDYGASVNGAVNTPEVIHLIDDSTDLLHPPVMIGANVFVAALEDGRLVRIENGAIRWAFKSKDNAPFASRIAVDAVGDVYAIDARARLVCVSSTGAVRWRVKLREAGDAVVTSDVLRIGNTIVVAEESGTIVGVRMRDGVVMWRTQCGALAIPALCADTRGVVHAITTGANDTLIRIDTNGIRLAPVALSGMSATALLMCADRAVVAGRTVDTRSGLFGEVRCIDMQGVTKWTTTIGTIPMFLSASNSTVYVVAAEPGAIAARSSRVIALSSRQGEKLWGVWYDVAISSPLLISDETLLCTVTEDAGSRWHDVMVLWLDGRIRRAISLHKAARALPMLSAAADGNVVLAAADGCTVIRCEEHVLYNILPRKL